MTKHLIIGGGPAAINAIETIRDHDNGSSEITLVCDERAYARMVLPYYLCQRIDEPQVYTGDDDYFRRLKVKTLFGRRVTRLDPQNKSATLDDGSTESFDDALIATGSSALMPAIEGAQLPGVFPMWTLAHTQGILQVTEGLDKPEVVFLGAGFIGFIVLNAMHKRGWKLKVIELADHVLPRMLNEASARLVEKWLTDLGVELHLGVTPKEISEDGDRRKVTLENSNVIEGDLVLAATGIKANLDLIDGSGIKTDVGILVDDRLRTNFDFIYAAGDVAQGPDLLSDTPSVHAIQPTAVDHGRIAGANMAEQEVHYPGSLLMNITDVCGLQCASFGRWNDLTEDTMTILNEDRPVYRRLLWTDDRITGAIFVGPANEIGMLNDLGMVKGLIQTQTPMGQWKEYLRENPFDIRRPYVALQIGKKLVETTLLGKPSKPRGYRHGQAQPKPQVTDAEAHKTYVETKGN